MCPDDRTTENDAGGRVGHELHKATRVALDHRLRVDSERHFGDADLLTDGEGLCLGQPDICDLWLGEDGRCGLVVVEVTMYPGVKAHDVLGDLAPLGGSDRRQLEAT